MDLSGVAGSEPQKALVVATYQLRNDGSVHAVDLVFVTASRNLTNSNVTFDGTPITAHPGKLGPVPASWTPPRGTPPLGTGADIPYSISGVANSIQR